MELDIVRPPKLLTAAAMSLRDTSRETRAPVNFIFCSQSPTKSYYCRRVKDWNFKSEL